MWVTCKVRRWHSWRRYKVERLLRVGWPHGSRGPLAWMSTGTCLEFVGGKNNLFLNLGSEKECLRLPLVTDSRT